MFLNLNPAFGAVPEVLELLLQGQTELEVVDLLMPNALCHYHPVKLSRLVGLSQ